MIKIIILALIVILCTMIGYLYGEGFKKRYVELNQLLGSLIDMENEILYSYRDLPEVIASIADKSSDCLREFFMDVAELLARGEIEDVNTAFYLSMNRHIDKLSIKKEDIDIVLDLSKSLGDTDIVGQGQIFALAKSKLDRNIVQAEKDFRVNCKMYKTLGIGIGAMIAIFLI